MTNPTISVTALQAQAVASNFLLENLPDRFCAGQPRLDHSSSTWNVPVLLTYPTIGVLGLVAEIWISSTEATVLSHSELKQIMQAAQQLVEGYLTDIVVLSPGM